MCVRTVEVIASDKIMTMLVLLLKWTELLVNGTAALHDHVYSQTKFFSLNSTDRKQKRQPTVNTVSLIQTTWALHLFHKTGCVHLDPLPHSPSLFLSLFLSPNTCLFLRYFIYFSHTYRSFRPLDYQRTFLSSLYQ